MAEGRVDREDAELDRTRCWNRSRSAVRPVSSGTRAALDHQICNDLTASASAIRGEPGLDRPIILSAGYSRQFPRRSGTRPARRVEALVTPSSPTSGRPRHRRPASPGQRPPDGAVATSSPRDGCSPGTPPPVAAPEGEESTMRNQLLVVLVGGEIGSAVLPGAICTADPTARSVAVSGCGALRCSPVPVTPSPNGAFKREGTHKLVRGVGAAHADRRRSGRRPAQRVASRRWRCKWRWTLMG